MATPYVMPKLAMAMNEGTISEWLVNHGDKVEKEQQLASVETEKVTYDVESPESGYFCIIVQQGETVPCEELIAYFCDTPEEVVELLASAAASAPAEDEGSAAPEPVSVAAPAATATQVVAVAPVHAEGVRIIASPLAKKMAKEAGLDLRVVAGTGPSGRIGQCNGSRL